ncbi:hypothetical protein SASPL_156952 [Salvia splendens]|uniref:Prokaryotic-type class I peptide chain release factors domain-containing protein n=1 Tax=Salvia splendens TaxID=180675 RepID=A0A8X8VVS1_SALSN|nr:hypothetical protein SASPL_156952 [Salvia splendens]
MSKRAAFWKSKLYEFHSHFFNRPIIVYRPPPQHRRIHLLTAKTLFRRLYSARAALSQSQPQLSNDLINIMEHKLSAIENRHAQLEAILNQPDASPEEYSTANKELKKLRHTIDVVSELRKKQQEIGGLKSLIDEADEDKDMREMAADELGQASQEEERLRYMLLKSLLPKDDVDERDCILEVRAGTGGEEASLFAMDIFKMYTPVCGLIDISSAIFLSFHDSIIQTLRYEKYSQNKVGGLKFLVWQNPTLKCRNLCADVYGKLKFESGIHRVQVDVQIRNEDLKIDTYRSGGSGGQSVNTTDSAVRILIYQLNKAKALKVLCAKLYELERTRLDANRSKLRTEQIGSGDRSERIRTYNFPQGRVTDHRVGITSHAIDDIMEGEDLDTFVDALILQQEMDAIASFTST